MLQAKIGKVIIPALFAGLMCGCTSEPPFECKDAAHVVTVQFQGPADLDFTKPNPLFDQNKTKARQQWASEVGAEFGAEWSNWDNTRSKSEACARKDDKSPIVCEAKAAPCKPKSK